MPWLAKQIEEGFQGHGDEAAAGSAPPAPPDGSTISVLRHAQPLRLLPLHEVAFGWGCSALHKHMCANVTTPQPRQ